MPRRSKSSTQSEQRRSAQQKENGAIGGQRGTQHVGDGVGDGGYVMLGYRHGLLFGCVLAIYGYTALPSIPGGDSGEILAEGCQFGIPHPPGYPLLNIIHFLVGALPAPPISPSTDCVFSTPSTVAWTANILSGIFGSGIAVFVCLAIEEWTRGSEEAYNLGAAATGALLFCLSPLAWEYSTGVEVFALNNLLVAVALYLTVRAIRAPSIKIARMGAVVCGLALSNQHASALVLGPLALFVLWSLSRKSLLSLQSVAELGGLWLPLGLSPYVALIFAAHQPKQGSWGDLSSVRGFLRHILRQEYGTLRLGLAVPNAEDAFERIREYLIDSSSQTMHVGPPMALLGMGWALKVHKNVNSGKRRREEKNMRTFGIALIAGWAFYVIFWHSVLSNISLQHPMGRAVHARFWMQPNLLLCLTAGGGFGLVANAAAAFLSRGFPLPVGRTFVTAIISISLPLGVAAGMLWLQWDVMDRGAWSGRSHGWTMHLYGQALLSGLPKRSILLSHTDLDLNAARYLRVCEHLRTDVTQISLQMMPYPWWGTVQADLHPGVTFPAILSGVSTRRGSESNAALITRFLAANLPLGRPIFLDMQAVDEREIGAAGVYRDFSLVPHGLVYRVLPKMTLQQTEKWHDKIILQLRSLDRCMGPVSKNIYPPGTWEFAASSVYWDAHYQAGLFFLSYGMGVWVHIPKAQQPHHTLPALRDASALLDQTLEAVDERRTFSSPISDLLKNTVLAKVRLLQAWHAEASKMAQAKKKTKAEAAPEVLAKIFGEIMLAKEQCLTLIARFLLEAIDDKDAEAFGKIYIKLREAEVLG